MSRNGLESQEPTMQRIASFASACAVLLLPLTALAIPAARQEYLDVITAKPNRADGAKLFGTCTGCHGSAGNGTEDGSVPRIAGQHFKVLAKQLVDYRHQQRRDTRAEQFTDRHVIGDAQGIADVAAYASQLVQEPPRHFGNGELVDHGARIYVVRCRSCHGRGGEGDSDRLVPRVGGLHYAYLLRRMYEALDGDGSSFSSAHLQLLATLERSDLVGVADFLSRSESTQTTPPGEHR
jgi:cytochrome c553